MTGMFPPRAGASGRPTAASTIGRKLQQARAELAATEDFVAATLGLSLDAYRDIERGAARLSPDGVIQAARLFGLQPSSLCSSEYGPRDSERVQTGPASVIDLAAARLLRQC